MNLREIRWQRVDSMPPALAAGPDPGQGPWLILADRGSFWNRLRPLLADRNQPFVTVFPGPAFTRSGPDTFLLDPQDAEGFARLLRTAFPADSLPCGRVVYLWGLDFAAPGETSADALTFALEKYCGSVIYLVDALLDRGFTGGGFVLVTRGSQSVGRSPGPVALAQAPLWALGAAIADEAPALGCDRIDLDPAGSQWEARSVLPYVQSFDGRRTIAFRDEVGYAASTVSSPIARPPSHEPAPPARSVQLEVGERGDLDSLHLSPSRRAPPRRGEVEIKVSATGLNFRDTLNALDMYPGDPGPFGAECAGTVGRIGDGVDRFEIGDHVMAAFTRTGAFRSYATVSARFVSTAPEHLSAAEAATLPIVYMTASYALHDLAGMKSGDRVLIHAAAGGVGLAAVHLARQAGAEIFCTAGNPKKRQYLKALGIRHVMNSRTLAFADEIRDATDGHGVDIVLNAFTGDFIAASLSILAPGGRFLEMGKMEILSPGDVEAIRNDVSYHAFDLMEQAHRNPELIRSLMDRVSRCTRVGTIRPLPIEVFSMHEVIDAFRFMSKARHIGKVVVAHEPGAATARNRTTVSSVRDGAVLVAGELNSFGQEACRRLIARGTRNLVIVDAREPAHAARRFLETLREEGTDVRFEVVDVSRADELTTLLDRMTVELPPLRGVVRLAPPPMDGEPGSIGPLQPRTAESSMVGAWNLHHLTRDFHIRLFLLLSSRSSGAAPSFRGEEILIDGFEDGLAHHRRGMGLPANRIVGEGDMTLVFEALDAVIRGETLPPSVHVVA